MPRHERVADAARSVLLVIDLQESYRDKLHEEARTVTGASRLLRAAGVLGVPVIVTEQYPERLGATREEIAAHVPETAERFPKRSFSCLGADGLPDHLRSLGRDQVVVAGIETHVCVLQTVHDLFQADLQVLLPRDAITSRFAVDDEAAMTRMVGAGALPTSSEGVLFEWVEDSRSPDFKAIHRLVV